MAGNGGKDFRFDFDMGFVGVFGVGGGRGFELFLLGRTGFFMFETLDVFVLRDLLDGGFRTEDVEDDVDFLGGLFGLANVDESGGDVEMLVLLLDEGEVAVFN